MSPEALLLCGGIGSMLVTAIVWLMKAYVGVLNQRADDGWRLAERGQSVTGTALDIAKTRR